MLGGLVLVLIIVVIANFRPRKKKRPPSSSRPTIVTRTPLPQPTPTSAPAKIQLATPEERLAQEIRANIDWGQDPFYHTVTAEVYESTTLVLKGVSIGRNKNGYAFINDEILTVGDPIAEYVVKEIHQNKVLLERGDELFYLVLPE